MLWRTPTILRAVFAGKPGPCRDVVVLNAAAVLVTAGLAADLRTGVVLAQETIDSGLSVAIDECRIADYGLSLWRSAHLRRDESRAEDGAPGLGTMRMPGLV